MKSHRQRKIACFQLIGALIALCLTSTVSAAEVVLQFAGDVMLGGRWEQELAQDQYYYPFAKISQELKAADITVVNLEAPLTTRGAEYREKKFRFRVNPVAAQALRKAGITTVSLANNHSMDFGAQGLSDTITALKLAGIDHIGAGNNLSEARRPVIYDIRGTKVALLGYSLTLPQEFWAASNRPGTAPLLEKLVHADISAARKQADIVVVTVHWGEEGTTRLRPYQPRLARMMIDAGADAVIGHHPHVLQGAEVYKQGIIFYSLGNFIFGNKSSRSGESLLVRLIVDGKNRKAELLPLNILHSTTAFQAKPLSTNNQLSFIRRFKALPPSTVSLKDNEARWLIQF